MHRFQSTSAIRRIRIASLLVCARCLLIPAALGGLTYSLVFHEQRIALVSLALIPLTGFLVLLQMLIATRTNCPLCMTPVLGEKSCNKHKKAVSVCGSYKLPVALSALFRKSFRCPYCNESSVLEVRRRG